MFLKKRDLLPEDVRAPLLASFPLKTNPGSDIMVMDGASVTVTDTIPEDKEARGFAHEGVMVGFRIDKFEEHDAGMANMIRIVDWLLRTFDVEADLRFDDSDGLKLFKSGGRLVLTDSDFWDDKLIELVKHPHEYQKL
jgi:hypothetical protein